MTQQAPTERLREYFAGVRERLDGEPPTACEQCNTTNKRLLAICEKLLGVVQDHSHFPGATGSHADYLDKLRAEARAQPFIAALSSCEQMLEEK